MLALTACQKQETAQQAFCRAWVINPAVPVLGTLSVDELHDINFDQWRQKQISALKKIVNTEDPEKTAIDIVDHEIAREQEYQKSLNYLAMTVTQKLPSGASRTKELVCSSGAGYCNCHGDSGWEREPARAFNAPVWTGPHETPKPKAR